MKYFFKFFLSICAVHHILHVWTDLSSCAGVKDNSTHSNIFWVFSWFLLAVVLAINLCRDFSGDDAGFRNRPCVKSTQLDVGFQVMYVTIQVVYLSAPRDAKERVGSGDGCCPQCALERLRGSSLVVDGSIGCLFRMALRFLSLPHRVCPSGHRAVREDKIPETSSEADVVVVTAHAVGGHSGSSSLDGATGLLLRAFVLDCFRSRSTCGCTHG